MSGEPENNKVLTQPFGWGIFAVALLLIGGFVSLTAEVGVAGTVRGIPPVDSELSISSPIAPTPSEAPFMSPFMLGPILFGLAVFGVVFWLSWRRRKLQPVAIVAMGTLFTGFIDPIANWATFAILNPEIPHFPLSWPWFNLAPLIEPVSAFLGGYSAYYLLVSLGIYWLTKKLAGSPLSPMWVKRRKVLGFFICAYVVSIPFNLLLQLAWMHYGVLVYTQCFGPILHIGNLQYPILIVLYDPFVYATIATLCLPDEIGNSKILISVSKRFNRLGNETNAPALRQIALAVVFVWLSILVPISFFAGVRIAGLATTPAYDAFPFPSAKIYDPYGDLERAGKEGPFYR